MTKIASRKIAPAVHKIDSNSAHPITPVVLVLCFIIKTKKTLCAIVKGERPLPLLDDGLLEACL